MTILIAETITAKVLQVCDVKNIHVEVVVIFNVHHSYCVCAQRLAADCLGFDINRKLNALK